MVSLFLNILLQRVLIFDAKLDVVPFMCVSGGRVVGDKHNCRIWLLLCVVSQQVAQRNRPAP